MALTISNGAANAAIDVITDLLDGGTLEIRSGTKPATTATTAAGTLLVTVTLGTPSFGAASTRSATITDPAGATASATGTAGWFRAKTSGGTAVIDGTVGTSGADLNLSKTAIVAGGSVDITGGTLSLP